MLSTFFRLIRLPGDIPTKMCHKVIDFPWTNSAIEVAAWLAGEDASLECIEEALSMTDNEEAAPLRKILERYITLPPLPKPDYITLEGIDGEKVQASKAYLCRRFHFFDDFLSTYPEEVLIKVPYPFWVLSTSINADSNGKLVDCLECLSFFNPKSPLYYFLLDTTGTPSSKLIESASMCSEQDRREVMRSRDADAMRYSEAWNRPLPGGGLGLSFLAHILELHGDDVNLSAIFSDYPSYLVGAMALEEAWIDEKKRERFDRLILTSDFGSSGEMCLLGGECIESIERAIVSSIKRAKTKENLLYLLTMCGIEGYLLMPKLDDDVDYVPAPYLIKINTPRVAGLLDDEDFHVHAGALLDVAARDVQRIMHCEANKRLSY